MKKNIAYYQQCIMNEIMKEYTTRDIADGMLKNDDLTVYSSDFNSVTFRNNKDITVTDNSLIKSFSRSLKKLVENSYDIIDILSDIYDIKYNEKYITEGFVSSIIRISRSGRLIRIDIDY